MASEAEKLAGELERAIEGGKKYNPVMPAVQLNQDQWNTILSALRATAVGEAEPRKRCSECHGILSIHDMRSSEDIGCNCLSRRMKSKP